MNAALHAIWAEIVTPSHAGEPPYLWMLIAIGHAVLGALLALALPGWLAVAGRVTPVLIYWLIKERGDLRRGGSLRDGLVDTGFVGLGLFYGAPWWPALVLGAAFAGAMLREARLPTRV